MAGFCKKCGRILGGAYDSEIICDLDCPLSQVPPERLKYRCDVCRSPVYKVPDEFTVARGALMNDELKEQFMEEYVKKSPEFDQELFDNRDRILEEQRAAVRRFEAKIAAKTGKAECPTCHSRNVQRISGVERGASILAFGIFSKKINKSFKCNSCGYTW